MNIKTYTFISDIGHGWLKVPYADLIKLGIHKEISGYSYYRKGMAYLEEDCDAYRFVEAAKKEGVRIQFSNLTVNRESKIRTYDSYNTTL